MFAIPGLALLLIFMLGRPQEFFTRLQAIPFLYLFFALTLFGLAVDYKLRRLRPLRSPQLFWVVVFFLWCLFTLVVRDRAALPSSGLSLLIQIILYLLIAYAVQTFAALEGLLGILLAITIYLSAIGVHQGLSPLGCHIIDWSSDDMMGTYDGRPCQTRRDCEQGDYEPGADYMCERVGVWGTSSIGSGRVRYRGPLNDPNNLALCVCLALPFAFAFFERRRTLWRGLLLSLCLTLIITCTVFTQSRGGQLVFLTVVAAYSIRRFGWRGLALGALVAVPILLWGGRQSEEAESSTETRLACWYEGMSMFKEHPVIGVGQGQFAEHYVQTAHNSYILAAAELGFIGFVLWSIVMYLSLKIPFVMLRRYTHERAGPETAPARSWSMAFIAAMCGLLVGILFLSFCYHQLTWLYIGLSSGLYTAAKRHDDGLTVKFGWRDFAWVVSFDAALIAALFVYTRIKGAP